MIKGTGFLRKVVIELATVYAKSLNVIAMSITTIIVDADKLKTLV
jgi:hypothetical protein